VTERNAGEADLDRRTDAADGKRRPSLLVVLANHDDLVGKRGDRFEQLLELPGAGAVVEHQILPTRSRDGASVA
jgi:hypothetical protein